VVAVWRRRNNDVGCLNNIRRFPGTARRYIIDEFQDATSSAGGGNLACRFITLVDSNAPSASYPGNDEL